jgi:hypothetical protein
MFSIFFREDFFKKIQKKISQFFCRKHFLIRKKNNSGIFSVKNVSGLLSWMFLIFSEKTFRSFSGKKFRYFFGIKVSISDKYNFGVFSEKGSWFLLKKKFTIFFGKNISIFFGIKVSISDKYNFRKTYIFYFRKLLFKWNRYLK